MGIGISFFTEAVGAGPRRHMDILGMGMADGVVLRVHPTGKAQLFISVQTQGQGHETTFAQIVAESSASPPRTSTRCTTTLTSLRTDSAPMAPARRR